MNSPAILTAKELLSYNMATHCHTIESALSFECNIPLGKRNPENKTNKNSTAIK